MTAGSLLALRCDNHFKWIVLKQFGPVWHEAISVLVHVLALREAVGVCVRGRCKEKRVEMVYLLVQTGKAIAQTDQRRRNRRRCFPW